MRKTIKATHTNLKNKKSLEVIHIIEASGTGVLLIDYIYLSNDYYTRSFKNE